MGRRVTESLVNAGCDVISISRSGKPPPYYCNVAMDSDQVKWISYDLDVDLGKGSDSSKLDLPKIDAAISCVGNVNPDPEWDKSTFFGLAFDDDRLYHENGILNEHAIKMAKEAGAETFVFLSVSYEVAKMVEGPLEGYMDGKRHAEHVAYELFGGNNAIVLGPSLIYGGKRFPKLGRMYRSFVESPIAKGYVGTNDALRSLSSAYLEDWVEKSIFSSPIEVDVVGRVATAAALGLVKRDMVCDRRQGFCNSDGKPVEYDNVIYVDGTSELERIDELVMGDLTKLNMRTEGSSIAESWLASNNKNDVQEMTKEAPFEGAFIGKGPYLLPLPVIAFFSTIFYFIATNQFVGDIQ